MTDAENQRRLAAVEPRVVDELPDVGPRVAGIAGKATQKTLAANLSHGDLRKSEHARGVSQGDRVGIARLTWSHDLEDPSLQRV